MEISTRKIRKILRTRWPELKHIWIFDRKLVLFKLEIYKEILKNVNINLPEFKDQLFDCDDYALIYNALVKLEIAKMKLLYNCAFGEASMVHPMMGVHNQNIFITDDLKIKLYEPQVGEIIEPTDESIFYVRM